MKIHLLLLFSILSISIGSNGCKSSKSMSNQGKDFIRIGFGGGFVGKESAFTLFQNGSLESEGKPAQKLSSNITNQLFSNFQTLGLKQVEFENPGNTYNFIEYQLNGVTKRLVWNPSDKTVQSELQLFYNNFNYYIKKNIK
mgnify:CR=1 FL=1